MSKYEGYNESRNKASQKYQKEHLEQLRVWVKKGKLDEYKAYAQARGLSLTAYIVQLIETDNP